MARDGVMSANLALYLQGVVHYKTYMIPNKYAPRWCHKFHSYVTMDEWLVMES
jgi:hypothetical protein